MGTTAATQELRRTAGNLNRGSGEPRPTRERSAPGAKPEEQPGNRRGGKRRRASKENEGGGTIRYFLTKTDQQRRAGTW